MTKKILLLGSGELGKEFVIAAKRLGQYVVACDSYAGAPAMQVADACEVFDMLDGDALVAAVAKHRPDIIVPEIDEETNKATIEKFKGIVESNAGEIVSVDEWGKRRLAYAIDYKTEGYYVLMSFNSAPEFPAELERNFKNDERIMRYMVTRKEA